MTGVYGASDTDLQVPQVQAVLLKMPTTLVRRALLESTREAHSHLICTISAFVEAPSEHLSTTLLSPESFA